MTIADREYAMTVGEIKQLLQELYNIESNLDDAMNTVESGTDAETYIDSGRDYLTTVIYDLEKTLKCKKKELDAAQ